MEHRPWCLKTLVREFERTRLGKCSRKQVLIARGSACSGLGHLPRIASSPPASPLRFQGQPSPLTSRVPAISRCSQISLPQQLLSQGLPTPLRQRLHALRIQQRHDNRPLRSSVKSVHSSQRCHADGDLDRDDSAEARNLRDEGIFGASFQRLVIYLLR